MMMPNRPMTISIENVEKMRQCEGSWNGLRRTLTLSYFPLKVLFIAAIATCLAIASNDSEYSSQPLIDIRFLRAMSWGREQRMAESLHAGHSHKTGKGTFGELSGSECKRICHIRDMTVSLGLRSNNQPSPSHHTQYCGATVLDSSGESWSQWRALFHHHHIQNKFRLYFPASASCQLICNWHSRWLLSPPYWWLSAGNFSQRHGSSKRLYHIFGSSLVPPPPTNILGPVAFTILPTYVEICHDLRLLCRLWDCWIKVLPPAFRHSLRFAAEWRPAESWSILSSHSQCCLLQNSAESMRLGLLTCVFETVPSMWRISYVFEMISPGDLCHVPSIFLIFDFLHSGRQFMLAGKCGAMSVLCNLCTFSSSCPLLIHESTFL